MVRKQYVCKYLPLPVIVACLVLSGSCIRNTESAGRESMLQVQEYEANQPAGADVALFDFSNDTKKGSFKVSSGKVTTFEHHLRLTVPAGKRGHIRFIPEESHWQLSDYAHLAINIENAGTNTIQLRSMVGNEGATVWSNSSINEGFLHPAQRKDFKVYFYRNTSEREQYELLRSFEGMNGLPGGFVTHWHTVDPGKITFIDLQVFAADTEQRVDIYNLRGARFLIPKLLAEDKDAFFPFIDRFGQYKYDRWPGKVYSSEDLKRFAREERADLKRHPGPHHLNKYGGWLKGPQLKVTGHFYTKKIDARWWLIDPEGRLFWSLGVTSVNPDFGTTRIERREHFFKWLPDEDTELAQFWHGSRGNPDRHISFSFGSANRFRKYGGDWRRTITKLNHRRLRSWGMNTLGAWTARDVCLMRRTPYTMMISFWCDQIGHKCPDVFAENFRDNLRARLEREKGITTDDPWCIGYFVNNEIEWRKDATELVSEILCGSPRMAAKKSLLADLKDKYSEIQDLNTAWNTKFETWEAMLGNTDEIDLSAAQSDTRAFYNKILDTYYRTCRDEIKRIAPGKLYLGSRFHKHNNDIIAAAGGYCDVITYNLYRTDLSNFSLPGVDKPLLAGEFHFGALDRGMLYTGLAGATDQGDRAALLAHYVTSALDNPRFVGVHWFTFNSQPTTGRGDGENGQIGLVDLCDSPYPETVAALRRVGYHMYERRRAVAER